MYRSLSADVRLSLWVCLRLAGEPNYKVHFHDDETFTLSTDLTTLKKEVERFEGKDGFSGFLSFLQEVCPVLTRFPASEEADWFVNHR